MNPTIKPTTKEFTVLHLFCGLGGGAIGFQQARGIYGALEGRFRTLGGVDIDREACADFERLTGAPATVGDLSKMTKAELRAAAQGMDPDVIFSSPPCKGFSGLLPNKRAAEEKYQRLNRLVFEGLFLALETFKTPKLIVIENVPKIQKRGAIFLAQVRQLLSHYGYVFHEAAHDCGEVGGLAQHRRRFLMVARQPKLVPTYVYKPAKQRVRAVGEVLSDLPLPDDPRCGPMHRLPRLEWQTWVRLALIPAGGDWRALGTRSDDAGDLFNNHLRIVPWDGPAGSVTGGGTPTAGGISVADPRFDLSSYRNAYRVVKWDEPSGTITGNGRPSAGAFTVADPRMTKAPGRHFNKMRVEKWDKPAHTVTGSDRVGSGAPSIADPRIAGKGSRPGLFGVLSWAEPAKSITGSLKCSASNTPAAVADPRVVTDGQLSDRNIPSDLDRPEPPPIIISTDETWHRPLTTLELAALQGLPVFDRSGEALKLSGKAQTRWRERIGNAVPPPAAKAIAESLLDSLLPSWSRATFVLGSGEIWVRRKTLEDMRRDDGKA